MLRILKGLAFLSFFVLAGCGSAVQDSGPGAWRAQVAACDVPADQQASFMAPVSASPVQLLVDSTFTPTQQAGIQAMVDQWNQLGQSLQGADFFTTVVQDVPDVLRSGNFGSCNIDAGTDSSSLYIVNEAADNTYWESLGFSTLIPGATIRCYQNDYLTKQVTVIRPDLISAAQFNSVIIHELGHTLGLDHSCTANASQVGANYTGCTGLPTDSPYASAVMYPSLNTAVITAPDGTTSVQQKEQLQTNDILRTGCLY